MQLMRSLSARGQEDLRVVKRKKARRSGLWNATFLRSEDASLGTLAKRATISSRDLFPYRDPLCVQQYVQIYRDVRADSKAWRDGHDRGV